jgi:NAD(P)-dependent dehydrogenase (short-subunit alcohol dehydrogenase family)
MHRYRSAGSQSPQDITDVITFLASDAARYMCGSLVEVNGGKPVV